MSLFQLLFGRRLASDEQRGRRLRVLTGIPALGLDSLASAAYGPEAALVVLVPLGTLGSTWLLRLSGVLLLLLLLLYLSYRRTIAAYPGGGGAYTVARENLGVGAGLLAAAALMIDYVLNVAVGISSGVGQLVSVVPALHPWRLELSLGILGLITLVNLRGTVESGVAFAVPTYTFVVALLGVLAAGLARAAGGAVAAPPAEAGVEAASAWILLRSFAAGCTAMTGVEAVSNGVTAFDDPPVRHARRTLTAIVALLALMLAGIAVLVHVHGIRALDETSPGYRSVLAQVVTAAVGRGVVHDVTLSAALAVLCLSANTSFVGFPRLCRQVAQDGWLPRGFATPGRRLVSTLGILVLAGAAGLLLLGFGGVTDRLIPLFAVGAFSAFTLSQAGMVAHARRASGGRLAGAAPLNLVGALGTGVALVIIVVAKLAAGAWITVIAIPAMLLGFRTVHRHYARLDAALRDAGPIGTGAMPRPLVVVPLTRWDGLTRKAVEAALRLSPDVVVLRLAGLEDAEPGEWDASRWTRDVEEPARAAGRKPPALVTLRSRYRRVVGPVLTYLERVRLHAPHRDVVVVVPEVAVERWWQGLLLDRRAARLVRSLLRFGGRRVSVLLVPWHLDRLEAEARREP